MSDELAILLDELFGQLAEASRTYLVAWNNARPTPSLCSTRVHGKLMDAENEIERVVNQIAGVFTRARA